MFPCAVRRLLLLFSALAALSLISFASLRAQSAPPAASPSPSNSTVVELRIDGEIEPILAEYIVRGIEQADAEHASLILITINTPGGLDTSMRDIIQSILRSPVPVVTYVYPTGSRAASAGFFILLSSDVPPCRREPKLVLPRRSSKLAAPRCRLTTPCAKKL
jgi:membrane-bound serine protease (ClpP class)